MNKAPFGLMWRPALAAPPSILARKMGQSRTAAPIPFLDSPELASLTDFVASASSGFLAYALHRNRQDGLSMFFGIVSAATGIKLLHDLSRF
jgi:hypothetical protein